jgi:hypothetical protein
LGIRVPQRQPGQFTVELMPVAQGLREFAPGRVSRRFGVTHGRQQFWIAPGQSSEVVIDGFCPANARQDLGGFRYLADPATIVEIRVFRPYVIDTTLTPVDVLQSSNSFLHWRTEVVTTALGEGLDLPQGSHWASVISAIRIHTHQMGLPVELRRFAISATAHIGRRRGQSETRRMTFSVLTPDGRIPAALGFVADVDSVEVEFQYPPRLRESILQDAALVRGLRVARFRYLVRSSPELESFANVFQRDWLAQAYLSSITAESVLNNLGLEEAESRVFARQSASQLEDVLLTILLWGAGAEDVDDDSSDDDDCTAPACTDDADTPRRYKELAALLSMSEVVEALHQAARALWEDPSHDWDPWLRELYKATLGAAFFDALHHICPRTAADALNLELTAVTSATATQTSQIPDGDRFWITESTLGGSGFVEEFAERYSEDPRRFFGFLDASLDPSDLEVAADDLVRVVHFLASADARFDPLRTAVAKTREAQSHQDSTSAIKSLRIQLSDAGVLPSPTLMISLGARLLRQGFTREADLFLARLLQFWTSEEQRLGIDIDVRVIAFVKSFDQDVDALVGTGDGGRAWRYGVLLGMLWARGAQIRGESLKVQNQFDRQALCDRLVVRAATSERLARVSLDIAEWWPTLANALVERGAAEVSCAISNFPAMASALHTIAVAPIESDGLLTYARLGAVQRHGELLVVRVELPEAWQ